MAQRQRAGIRHVVASIVVIALVIAAAVACSMKARTPGPDSAPATVGLDGPTVSSARPPTPVEVTSAAAPTARASSASADLVSRFAGTWAGIMTQPTSANSPYPIKITVTPGGVGQKVAQVEYATLECGGTWTLEEVKKDSITLTEVITYGPRCVPVDLVVVRPDADGNLYVTIHIGAIGTEPYCWATLKRT